MRTSDQINELAEALALAQGEMPDIPKTKTAGKGNFAYKYADIADVLSVVRPVLSKHGLAVMQSVELDDQITTRLAHKSGQWVESTMAYVLGSGNMSPMQLMGSSITYARRYALSALLGIQADEDTDNAEQRPQKGDKQYNSRGQYTGTSTGRKPQGVAQLVAEHTEDLPPHDEALDALDQEIADYTNAIRAAVGADQIETVRVTMDSIGDHEYYKDVRRGVWQMLSDHEKDYVRTATKDVSSG